MALNSPQVSLLPDGRRLHLQHGPIDLVVEAYGDRHEIGAAYNQACDRFETILTELAGELAILRQPARDPRPDVSGPIAERMLDAVWPHREIFVTPMAAVAGSVADEVKAALVDGRILKKAYVNNSGDIAVHVTDGQTLRLGIVGQLLRPAIDGTTELSHSDPVRGVATSGWQGRSWSFGIADAVTVLARNAAAADVAATLIANAVNATHPAIERRPAEELDDQTDLGDRMVTVNVGALEAATVEEALAGGMKIAQQMFDAGLISAAVLVLKNEIRAIGDVPAALPETA